MQSEIIVLYKNLYFLQPYTNCEVLIKVSTSLSYPFPEQKLQDVRIDEMQHTMDNKYKAGSYYNDNMGKIKTKDTYV